MLGDEPAPSVMTARVGFGEVSDAHARGSVHCAERAKRSYNKRTVGLRNINGGEGEVVTNNGCTFYENIQMQCA